MKKRNAIKIDNNVIKDEKFELDEKKTNQNFIKLSIGKKRHLKIEFN